MADKAGASIKEEAKKVVGSDDREKGNQRFLSRRDKD